MRAEPGRVGLGWPRPGGGLWRSAECLFPWLLAVHSFPGTLVKTWKVGLATGQLPLGWSLWDNEEYSQGRQGPDEWAGTGHAVCLRAARYFPCHFQPLTAEPAPYCFQHWGIRMKCEEGPHRGLACQGPGFVSQALCPGGSRERTPWFQDGMASGRTVEAGENGAGPAGSSGTLVARHRLPGLRRLLPGPRTALGQASVVKGRGL